MSSPLKKLVIFDLDGTLTQSKSDLDPAMADLLMKLMNRTKVAIISGGGYDQFQKQFLAHMPAGSANYSNLVLLPTSGTRMWLWHSTWTEEYAEHLNAGEKTKILYVLQDAIKDSGYAMSPDQIFGDLIEDRGSQITYSALGQKAPIDKKLAWDPKREKREKIVSLIRTKLPEFDVRVGGSTSVDVTRRGVNKAYGIHKLEQFFGLTPEDIVFVGDALFYGGNDYPARSTGVDCVSVTGPAETGKLIAGWLQ